MIGERCCAPGSCGEDDRRKESRFPRFALHDGWALGFR
jgi:hypothetical protein